MEVKRLVAIMANRGMLVLLGLAAVGVSYLVHAPASEPSHLLPGAPLAVPASSVVSPAILLQARTNYLRDSYKVQVSAAPADSPPIPPTPLAPVVYRVATAEPVIFITIDDGVSKPADLETYLADVRVPITAFLTTTSAHPDFAYFRRLQSFGTSVQNHTLHHPHLRGVSLPLQRQELCSASDILAQEYGERPTLFRSPYGEYDDVTRQAAAECGMKAVLYWSAVVQQGYIHYQPPHTHLVAGDIVLLHFRPEILHDVLVLLQAAHEQGLLVARLEDYLR